VSEAPSRGQSVISYDPASSGALAYTEAARELATQSAAARRLLGDTVNGDTVNGDAVNREGQWLSKDEA
jgi:hypothetical protein